MHFSFATVCTSINKEKQVFKSNALAFVSNVTLTLTVLVAFMNYSVSAFEQNIQFVSSKCFANSLYQPFIKSFNIS